MSPAPSLSDTGLGTNVAVLERVDTAVELPYEVILWDDPVSTMALVVIVLKRVFHFSTEKATELMMIAHETGRVVVWAGDRAEAESYCVQLHTFGLSATVSSS